MAEVVALWLAFLSLAGVLNLDNKLDALFVTASGIALGTAVFVWTTQPAAQRGGRRPGSPPAAAIAHTRVPWMRRAFPSL